jgi:thiol-disulfide isomerase/thioredoxin
MKDWAWPVIFGVVILGFVYIQFTSQANSSLAPAGTPTAAVGVTAPAFSAATIGGGRVDFPSDFEGKLVLLDFWATWCMPCRAEAPHLLEAYEKYNAAGLEIVGVSLDRSEQPVTDFVRRQKLPWRQVQQNAGRIATRYGVSGIPALFLVDGSSGEILAEGVSLRGKALLQTIRQNLERIKGRIAE